MKRKISSLTAITIRISAIALAFWLLVMGLITWGGVREVNDQLQREIWNFQRTNGAFLHDDSAYMKVYGLNTLKWGFDVELNFPFALDRRPGIDFMDEAWYGYDVALIAESPGGPTVKNGPYCYFQYFEEADWETEAKDRTKHAAAIDLNAFAEGSVLAVDIGTEIFDGMSLYPFNTVRFTGYFEEGWFYPVTMDVSAGLEETPGEVKPKRWRNIFSREVDAQQELVTIYTNTLSGVNANEKPVTLAGVRYESLTDALEAFTGEKGMPEKVFAGITNTVVMSVGRVYSQEQLQSSVAVAVRCNPLAYSLSVLWPVYVVTLAILAAMVALLIFKIRRELTEPVRQVNLVARGLSLPERKSYEPRWQEPYELERIVKDTRQALQEAKAEIRQLQTALEYAKDAESYRRRMISGLTHELKTPLAVIHSYAEGLQEGIAQEKKEQYLGVILEESEKMDAMVLQMLDLSRLEAGKVKLAADNFSLAALTRAVFDKMQPLAEAKGLTVRFTVPNECRLTADEGRITQVVTNLASNAIKYTPEGGEISVIVYRKNDTNILCVENTCPRLSDEALSKVFDSFYRGDDARTTEGTGLGLAIVKAIVEQHGGSCRAFNTPTGVQFQVILP